MDVRADEVLFFQYGVASGGGSLLFYSFHWVSYHDSTCCIAYPSLMRKKSFSRPHGSLLDPDEILADSISALNAGGTIWEGKIEKPIGKLSSFLFLSITFLGMGYLMFRAGSLQITRGDEFYLQSQENRFVTRTLFPPRGIFYDKNHTPLVENIPSFSIVFEKDAFINAVAVQKESAKTCPTSYISDTDIKGNVYPSPSVVKVDCITAQKTVSPSDQLKIVLGSLSGILKKDSSFFSDLGFPKDYSVKDAPNELVIARDIPLDMVAEVNAKRDALQGIVVIESYRREYKNPYALSHLVGFIGKVSGNDMQANSQFKFEESIGKSGLEQFYDAQLRGTVGKKIVEGDSKGKETRFRLTQTPVNGSPLLLTIDGDLQNVSYDLLKSYTNGANGGSVVVMDVRTGAIRALVSFPGFDSNKLSSSISNKEFQQLLSNRLSPMFDRSIAGEFPSGSVIKPLFAAAALQEHIIDPHKKVFTQGYIEIPNPYHPGESSIFKDWKNHGWVDFYDAIANSVDVYFYMIGGGYKDQKGLGIDRLKKYAHAFGIGSKLGIDLPGEKEGFFPDPSNKALFDPKDPLWRVGDTYNVSIGQGGVKITPLQITAMIAAIANGGTLYRPHLLDAVLDDGGNIIKQIKPYIIRKDIIDGQHLEQVRIGMREAVTAGTARSLNDLPILVAAKTGTAQAGIKSPHAWFVAFAPYENPEIAITVMVEHGGEGSSIAAPITKEILKWYYSKHESLDTGGNIATTTPDIRIE